MPKIFGFLVICFCLPVAVAYAELQTAAIAQHEIKSGENLYSIARRYNVDVRGLIRANRLKPPYIIRIGDKLKIPGAPYHVVKRGETLSFIARKYDVGLRSLVVLNKIKPPYVIQLKQKIYIPTPDKPDKSDSKIIRAPRPPKNENTEVSIARAPLPARRDTADASSVRAPLPPSRDEPADKEVSIARAPLPPATLAYHDDDYIDNGASFLPPVSGKIISRFGKQELGVYNDGINFAEENGKPIRSARDGEVVYSDDSLKRLGNLILIRHKHGYITAYAHNAKNLVRRGQRVKRGQVIALVGNSGHVKRPQLHFQIRRGTEILNPEKYIGDS